MRDEDESRAPDMVLIALAVMIALEMIAALTLAALVAGWAAS